MKPTPLFIIACMLATIVQAQDPNLKLWYNKPAGIWEEALPLGNEKPALWFLAVWSKKGSS